MAPGPAVAKVVVALPAGQVLRKELRLPAAVEQDLKQALAYDLDRHTPFKPDELHFDAAVVGRDRAKGRDTRRLGGGAAQRGDGSAPPRGELGSDGRRRHAGCAGRRRPGDVAALASQPVAGG